MRLPFIPFFLALFLFSPCLSQIISPSSYARLYSYSTNPYFQVINQILTRAYSSYLDQTTISSVYIYQNTSMVSLIINYQNRNGAIYRGTVNYFISSNQLSVESFGPIITTARAVTPGYGSVDGRGVTIYSDSGIGITLAAPPNSPNELVAGSNPRITNQNVSILLLNSTRVSNPRNTRSDDDEDDDEDDDDK